jgi:hypothetical protein
MRSYAFLGGVALPVLALAMAMPAMAQSVSSSIRGTVIDSEGFAVPNAAVEVRNEGTGQVKRMTTSAGGFFTATGLSVGDTYTVAATAEGYKPSRVTDIRLTLGEPLRLDVAMEAIETAGEEVTVVGIREASQAIDSRGVGAQYDQQDIAMTTSLGRDFKDIVAQSPLAYIQYGFGGDPISIAGANPRCNSFQVDGLPMNDSFGLNFNGYPTARSPVPFDWSEQVQVAVTPYDTVYNDFCGGVINVVTKTGENDFHGSAYYYYKSDGLTGDKSDGQEYRITDFEEKNWGATFSGPIIEDTLFFFIGYDKTERVSPVSIGPGEGNPSGTYATQIAGISQDDIDRVREIAQSVYGYDPLALTDSFTEENERYFAKLNWNITDDHRAQITYSHAEGGTLNTRSATTGAPTLGLPSNWYLDAEEIDTYSLQVFSDWTERLSTELRVGRVEVTGNVTPLGSTEFPEIFIRTNGANGVYESGSQSTDDSYIAIGPDQFRHYNILEYTADVIKFSATYDMDAHVIRAGYERKMLDILNGFVEGSKGIYRFGSIEDFAAGLLATDLDFRLRSGRGQEPIRYQNAPSNNPIDGSAIVEYNINSLYLQDDWDVNEHLSVMFGLRYDWYENEIPVVENPTFEAAYGFKNTTDLGGIDILLPRASFSYDIPSEDETTSIRVRGGIGRYSGGSPNVWIVNSFGPGSGIGAVSVLGVPGQAVPGGILPGRDIFAADPSSVYPVPQSLQDLLARQTAGSGGSVSALDPGFDIPSVYRYNLGVDVSWDEWSFTAEYLHMSALDQLRWVDLRTCVANSAGCGTVTAPAPDADMGRVRYSRPLVRSGSGNDFLLTNAEGGESQFVIFAAQKTWDFNEGAGEIDLSLGYTWSDITDIGGGTSSTSSSNYNFRTFINANDREEGRSDYERAHRFTMTADFEYDFFEGSPTRLRIFGQSMSGQPFSYVYTNNPFGGNAPTLGALVYVPEADPTTGLVTATSDPRVLFDPALNLSAFNTFLETSGLDRYEGQIAPRNAFFTDWTTSFDLSVQQEISVYEEHAVTLEFSIFNFTNLLNNKWGRYAYFNNVPNNNSFVTADIVSEGTITAGGECLAESCYVYRSLGSVGSNNITRVPSSLWQIQLGIRYQF